MFKTIARHAKKKYELLGLHSMYAGKKTVEMTEEEKLFDLLLDKLRKSDEEINVTENFLTHFENYEKSKLVQLLKKMPKGSHLHIHNLAAGSFDAFAEHILKAKNLYLTEENVFKFTNEVTAEKSGLKHITKLTKAEIYSLLTMPTGDAMLQKEECWNYFGSIWGRILGMSMNSYFYDGVSSFYFRLLKDQYDSGVRYVELRNGAGEVYENELGERLNLKDFLKIFKKTTDMFKITYPDFIGCKLILCGHKSQTKEEIKGQIEHTIDLMKDGEVGNVIAGYDLVGEEDTLHPLESYVDELKIATTYNLPLILHAGETNNSDRTCLYDAFLLGSKRVGHGYDLINHPILLEKFKESNMVVECCPISNDSLGYVKDMRNHSGKTMIAHGVKLTISADDPGMFHYHDVSYDWALVTKAWKLNVKQLKALVTNSIEASLISDEEKKQMTNNFDRDWKQFVEHAVKE